MAARISYRLVLSVRSLSLVGGSLLVLLHASCSSTVPAEPAGALASDGVGVFSFTSPNGPHPEIPVDIWYHRPEANNEEAPIMVVDPASSVPP